MLLLNAENISVRFGGFVAVDQVSLSVKTGELVGLIGPNGAGKSTVFAALSGFEPEGEGSIEFKGDALTGTGPAARARYGLGRTFQVPKEFSHLSVRENLLAASPGQAGESLIRLFLSPGSVRRQELTLRDKADEILSFLNLSTVAGLSAVKLSGGQKKLLELGRVLMTNPKLILLDEPFAGINPVLIEEISNRIRELSARGVAFLIVEHNLNALSKLASRLYAMDRGRFLCEGTPDEVLQNKVVQEAYMGSIV